MKIHPNEKIIPKENLVKGIYYKGWCRNATVARWDGKQFWHWRTKFGHTFLESISCPEDDPKHDVFRAHEVCEPSKIIPLDYENR